MPNFIFLAALWQPESIQGQYVNAELRDQRKEDGEAAGPSGQLTSLAKTFIPIYTCYTTLFNKYTDDTVFSPHYPESSTTDNNHKKSTDLY